MLVIGLTVSELTQFLGLINVAVDSIVIQPVAVVFVFVNNLGRCIHIEHIVVVLHMRVFGAPPDKVPVPARHRDLRFVAHRHSLHVDVGRRWMDSFADNGELKLLLARVVQTNLAPVL